MARPHPAPPVIDFDGLEDLDGLDLGPPREFDVYVCELFERERPVQP